MVRHTSRVTWLLPTLALSAAAPLPCPADQSAGEPTAEARALRAIPDSGRVIWADPNVVHQRAPRFSWEWALVQLVPSPELGAGRDGAVFGLRWQLTPFLYSFSADPRTRPWRFFIAEPIVRHSGSIELFVSPEYLSVGRRFSDGVGGRAGVRSYFGVIERGDYLSISLAASYYDFAGERGVAYEAGAYALFGGVGVALSYAPAFAEARWLSTLRLRFF